MFVPRCPCTAHRACCGPTRTHHPPALHPVGVYANNRASGLLRSDHPLCLAPMVDFNGDDLYFGLTKARQRL